MCSSLTIDSSATAVSTPENCTVTATGYSNGDQVANQTFTYDQDTILNNANLDAPMELAVLSEYFVQLTEVDFTYAQTTVDTPPSLLVDDVKYKVYLNTGKGKGKGKPWSG